jgi:outer membrane protein OmpA-like peptidoglycan-associated protein
MKNFKFTTILMCVLLVFSGCGTMNNTTKGTAIGAGSGAALGAVIGGLLGHGKGAVIGAAIGTAVGGGTGAIIGKKMDKKAEEAARVANAQVEKVTDANGLEAVKVTFDSGILFKFNDSSLNPISKKSLAEFSKVLKEDQDVDIAVYGYTDKVGTEEANQIVSTKRANAVRDYLSNQGVSSSQFKTVQGLGYSQYDESLPAAKNRKVEVYMYASKAMIQKAQQQQSSSNSGTESGN